MARTNARGANRSPCQTDWRQSRRLAKGSCLRHLDVETYRAVLPALATTGGMLVGISSPYRRSGLLFERFRDHFDKSDDDVLVVRGPSLRFNPMLDRSVIERAR